MNGKPAGLLVAGDYGASDDESEHESSQYFDMNIRRSHTSSALQEVEQTKKEQYPNTQGKICISCLHMPIWPIFSRIISSLYLINAIIVIKVYTHHGPSYMIKPPDTRITGILPQMK